MSKFKNASHCTFRILRCFSVILFTLFWFNTDVVAQNTDSSLVFQKLAKDDIIDFKPQKQQKVYAAGRIMEDQKNIPRVIYVITKEQIALEGYSTLVDILKNIPGYRISQPGTAQLGETFTNRGMLGNVYAKILINGLPVSPSGAPGMPIGSQLPIQQAERIEIIVDPASTLYGSDAMAGVINIVLPDISRPVAVSSNVRIGSNGLTEINTSIGGKLGKNKNVFTYNLYGTNKYVADYTIDQSQFIVDSAAQNSPFYIGEADDPSKPEIRAIPHQSSLIGLRATYRGLSFNGNVMSRQDHSALGAHPNRISYANPGSYFGESIYHGALQYNKNINDNWAVIVNATVVAYEMDENSSYIGVNHDLSNGINYMYAESVDLKLEPIVSYSKKRITLLAGGLLSNSSGINFQNFMARPYIEDNQFMIDSMGNKLVSNSVVEGDAIDSVFRFDDFNFNALSLFSQLFYKGDKLNILAGFRYESRSDVNEILESDTNNFNTGIDALNTSVTAFNPSIGVLYYITEKITVNGSYTHAFQTPGPYYQSNNYRSDAIPGGGGVPPSATPFQRYTIFHNPEYLTTISLGANYYFENNSGKISASFFRNNLENSLFTEIKQQVDTLPAPPNGYSVGYFNRSTESTLNGFQLSYVKEFSNFFFDAHGAYYIGHEEIEGIEDTLRINSYRSVPTYELKCNLKARIFKKNALGLNFQFYGPFVNSIIVAKGALDPETTGASSNLDVYFNREFGKNLTATFKVNNLLNTVNKGIFTNWLDGYDFNYVPQLQRWFFIHLNYHLN
ncbi:MAG: TonB-dependent receptor plug domain-containing protein [Crocinitomix sp.]|nr:TonB-dependent receptor plug domain-containing protein [Crocinitomix sp.]